MRVSAEARRFLPIPRLRPEPWRHPFGILVSCAASSRCAIGGRSSRTRAPRRVGLQAPTTLVCCYPREPGFITAIADRLRDAFAQLPATASPRVLFSAHGLPKRIVVRGDPYRWQVEQSCAAVVATLGRRDLDWRICYQSRVGRLEWIGPGTDAEIEQAGRDGVPVIVVPIAFVSEHSEPLVELDMEYAALAKRSGVPVYIRVPTVSTLPPFIAGLAGLVRGALAAPGALRSGEGRRLCPDDRRCCAMRELISPR